MLKRIAAVLVATGLGIALTAVPAAARNDPVKDLTKHVPTGTTDDLVAPLSSITG